MTKVLRIRARGLLGCALPCGSFVFLNRKTSGRSKYAIFGTTTRRYVTEANQFLARNFVNFCIDDMCLGVETLEHLLRGDPFNFSGVNVMVHLRLISKLLRLATRAILLCILAMARTVHWYIEQPGSSLFLEFPYLKLLRELMEDYIPISDVRLPKPHFPLSPLAFSLHPQSTLALSWMAIFGHRSCKPSFLVGTPPATQ